MAVNAVTPFFFWAVIGIGAALFLLLLYLERMDPVIAWLRGSVWFSFGQEIVWTVYRRGTVLGVLAFILALVVAQNHNLAIRSLLLPLMIFAVILPFGYDFPGRKHAHNKDLSEEDQARMTDLQHRVQAKS